MNTSRRTSSRLTLSPSLELKTNDVASANFASNMRLRIDTKSSSVQTIQWLSADVFNEVMAQCHLKENEEESLEGNRQYVLRNKDFCNIVATVSEDDIDALVLKLQSGQNSCARTPLTAHIRDLFPDPWGRSPRMLPGDSKPLQEPEEVDVEDVSFDLSNDADWDISIAPSPNDDTGGPVEPPPLTNTATNANEKRLDNGSSEEGSGPQDVQPTAPSAGPSPPLPSSHIPSTVDSPPPGPPKSEMVTFAGSKSPGGGGPTNFNDDDTTVVGETQQSEQPATGATSPSADGDQSIGESSASSALVTSQPVENGDTDGIRKIKDLSVGGQESSLAQTPTALETFNQQEGPTDASASFNAFGSSSPSKSNVSDKMIKPTTVTAPPASEINNASFKGKSTSISAQGVPPIEATSTAGTESPVVDAASSNPAPPEGKAGNDKGIAVLGRPPSTKSDIGISSSAAITSIVDSIPNTKTNTTATSDPSPLTQPNAATSEVTSTTETAAASTRTGKNSDLSTNNASSALDTVAAPKIVADGTVPEDDSTAETHEPPVVQSTQPSLGEPESPLGKGFVVSQHQDSEQSASGGSSGDAQTIKQPIARNRPESVEDKVDIAAKNNASKEEEKKKSGSKQDKDDASEDEEMDSRDTQEVEEATNPPLPSNPDALPSATSTCESEQGVTDNDGMRRKEASRTTVLGEECTCCKEGSGDGTCPLLVTQSLLASRQSDVMKADESRCAAGHHANRPEDLIDLSDIPPERSSLGFVGVLGNYEMQPNGTHTSPSSSRLVLDELEDDEILMIPLSPQENVQWSFEASSDFNANILVPQSFPLEQPNGTATRSPSVEEDLRLQIDQLKRGYADSRRENEELRREIEDLWRKLETRLPIDDRSWPPTASHFHSVTHPSLQRTAP